MLILVFESFPILLTGCTTRNFDISSLRYFTPLKCRTVEYVIVVGAKKFEGISVKTLKTVNAIYASKSGERVNVKSAQFSNSWKTHEFWHKWVEKNFSFGKALQSEWWWMSGKISQGDVVAWYDEKTVFILMSKDMNLLRETEKELKTFTKTFAGVRS